VLRKGYSDYSKKKKSVEIGKVCIKKGDKILLIDDIFESGGVGRATIHLIEKLGGEVKGIFTVFNKLDKTGEKYFKKYNYHYLIKLEKKKKDIK